MKQKLKSKEKAKEKTKKEYVARSGSPFKKREAQLIGEELENIRKKYGYLTSEFVLKEARDKNSKLHNFFEWNRDKAAVKWLMQQARVIIQHVVEIVVTENFQTEQRSFLPVKKQDVGIVYVTIDEAIENIDYRRQLLDRMIVTQKNLLETMELFKGRL